MSPAGDIEAGAPLFNRRRALTVLTVGMGAGLLAACSGESSVSAPEVKENAPTVTYEPAADSEDVLPTAPAGVKVENGVFQRVSLTNANGKVVAGKFNSDRTAFTVTEPLGYESTYTWAGSVVGSDGKAESLQGTFSTVAPQKQVNGQFQLADG
nr:Ig-like domain-containing protein [Streptomyces sp. DSM 41633]